MQQRILVSTALLVLLGSGCPQSAPPRDARLSVNQFLQSKDVSGFSRAVEPVDLSFPRDHGAHPDFKTEWWYVTGNLQTGNGRRFGFQFTLFRNALSPQPPSNPSQWATNQAFLSHLAVTDVETGEFFFDERFSRGALGLAGVHHGPFRAWLEDWQISSVDDDSCHSCFRIRLLARSDKFDLDLNLSSAAPPVLHGNAGLSQKSATPGNASYYYSYTRLKTSGRISVGGQLHDVSGSSWLDHEWSTSYLEDDQIGWDWFSVQLSDQTELMLFQLRHKQDPAKHYLYGSYVDETGQHSRLDASGFTIEAVGDWLSPDSGVDYPAGWRITVPDHSIELTLHPVIPNQEINASFRYWEGAIDAAGSKSGARLTGQGYVELTGYN